MPQESYSVNTPKIACSAQARLEHSLSSIKVMLMAKTLLMCPPQFFGVEYEINPWMHVGEQIDTKLVRQEWQGLYDVYTKRLDWHVEQIQPVKGLPDMVFATDSCLVIDDKVFLSNFRYPERQGETVRYKQWFLAHGYTGIYQPAHHFEGGDVRIWGDKIIAGFGFRTSREALKEMESYFGREVVGLHLTDPLFFHLDTCLTTLNAATVAFYPDALDHESKQLLRSAVPNIIEATIEEAKSFGLNAVSDGRTVITSNESRSLLQKYRQAGFEVIGVPILEFRKSGGGVKCMTLELNP